MSGRCGRKGSTLEMVKHLSSAQTCSKKSKLSDVWFTDGEKGYGSPSMMIDFKQLLRDSNVISARKFVRDNTDQPVLQDPVPSTNNEMQNQVSFYCFPVQCQIMYLASDCLAEHIPQSL